MKQTTFPAGTLFASFADINTAVAAAYAGALADSHANAGRKGIHRSRGKYIKIIKGCTVIKGEAESWAWDGTKKALLEAIAEGVALDADTVGIDGGFDHFVDFQAVRDYDYDCWTGEWSVDVWSKEQK